jgi:hypothetical protein
MDYLTVKQARDKPGLRLVLTEGMPGPWAEAIKSVLAYKKLAFVAVAQYPGAANEDLQDWTGQTSAPVAIYGEEAPRSSWLDQLLLAERLAPAPAVLPLQLEQRALVLGLCHEIAGENGLGWNRRLHMLAPALRADDPPEPMQRMGAKYGWSEQALAAADNNIGDCLDYFSDRLRTQAANKSDYLVGDVVTAADFYLANFMGIFRPLPETMNPMPAVLRHIYSQVIPSLEGYISAELLRHRDHMYEHYIQTPLDF